MSYRVNSRFATDCGFPICGADVEHAALLTNSILSDLPASLFRSIDYKTTSSIIGAIFAESLADHLHVIVNPIEKGHPDILPPDAIGASEAVLRNYPSGLEIKNTIGNITQGANLRAGVKRVTHMTKITWQAHHRDVKALMGLTWDFVQEQPSFRYPAITGTFYADRLEEQDWGKISGTTGRNTKVCGMRASGKAKMGKGWILLWDDTEYLAMFRRCLSSISL